MPDILVVSKLVTATALPEDYAQNTWVFHADAGTAVDAATSAMTKLDTFYTTVGDLLGVNISRTADIHTHTAYDIAGELLETPTGLGTPIHEDTFTIPAPVNTAGLPSEIAICMSFHATLTGAAVEVGATRPRSRRHGRVYLGPLNLQVVNEESGQGVSRPRATVRTQIAAAGAALIGGSGAIWSVWSRTDKLVRPVVGGWVDNAFDVQRRRGVATTARTTF